jgi:hypothetical protein
MIMKANLSYGNYFNYGKHYQIKFDYSNDEERQYMFNIFENGLIPATGSHSSRAKEKQEYIMPYIADNDGNMTTANTGVIGGTSIPEDLLPQFIQRFIEMDNCPVVVNGTTITEFDLQKVEKQINGLRVNATLKKGEYFNYGEHYYVEFSYASKEQKREVAKVFDQELIPATGSHSSRVNEKQEYIMPYMADSSGNMTTANTGVIGGTSIPEDLLPQFVKRFVEADKMVVNIGDGCIKNNYSNDTFDKLLSNINGKGY